MDKKDIVAFFDRLAPQWDADMIKNDGVIETILDNAQVAAGQDVLDVACGTGVMFDHYLQRQVASVTGIDISPEMAKRAAEKYRQDSRVSVICGDVEEAVFDRKFHRIVVYNAFPHFPDPEGLLRSLSRLLPSGGILTIAHGMSRAHIDAHHKGAASKVSLGLMHEDQLAQLMGKYLRVTVKRSDDTMYQLVAIKD